MLVVDEATGTVSGIYPDILRTKGRKMGCTFEFPIASRARAELMFRNGDADLLVGATQQTAREPWGTYEPMVRVEWVLVSSMGRPLPRTAEELASMTGIRFNAVRGYNYGLGYGEMLRRLDTQRKLEMVSSPETVAKKMLAGRADFTFMPSNTFSGALDRLDVEQYRREQFQYTRLEGIPASTSGVYLSRQLTEADGAILSRMLNEIRAEGLILARAKACYGKRDLVSLTALPNTGSAQSLAVATR